jgi:hypothetical protein
MPSRPDEDLDALVRRRTAEAERAREGEVRRILAIADPAERMRAYAELSRVLAEDGETLPPETVARIAGVSRASPALKPLASSEERAAAWQVERRRLALLFLLRPWAAAGCVAAAVAPFLLAAARGPAFGIHMLAAMALAVLLGVVMACMTSLAENLEHLAGCVVAAFAGSVVAVAVALSLA